MSAARALPEVELAPGTLAIADLHLDVGPQGPEPRAFLEFLERVRGAPRLVILGDLFDAWIGPAQAELPAAARVVAALAALRERGTALDIVHGNRDFLLESRFEQLTGARVHPAGLIGLAGGQRTLLIHGDELCTLDLGYQRLKRALRSRAFLALAPRVPRPLALGIARRLRRASVAALASKPDASKAQQREEAGRLARSQGCSSVVVGHAHAFRDELDGAVRWIVLDAFGGARDVLEWGSAGTLRARSSAPA